MKTKLHTLYAVLALSLLVLLAAGPASALMEPHDLSGLNPAITSDVKVSDSGGIDKSNPVDFNQGRLAGFEAGRGTINSCFVDSSASLDDDLNRGKSRAFVAGFDSGYKEIANLYNYSYCGR